MSFPKLGNMVTTISDVSQYNLQWSFGPLINLMRPFGIDFNVAGQRSSILLIFLRILGISSVIYAVIVFFVQLLFELIPETNSRKIDGVGNPKIQSWHFKILVASFLLLELQFSLFSLTKWRSLWIAAEEMEERLQFNSTFYQRLRKTCLSLALFSLTMVRQIIQ